MRIGSAWNKTSEKTGKPYISVSLDEAAIPLTITEDKFITLWELSDDERKDKEKSPHYSVSLSKANEKEER